MKGWRAAFAYLFALLLLSLLQYEINPITMAFQGREWQQPSRRISSVEANLLTGIIGQLSRSGSLGEREQKKLELQEKLSGLDKEVAELMDKHHEDFFVSLHSVITAVARVDDARERATAIRKALKSCQTLLHCKQNVVRQMWTESLEHAETLRLLDQIDDIKKAPIRINRAVSERQYLKAARILVSALETRSTLRHVGALEELGHVLQRRRDKLTWELIEELHKQLYLHAGQLPPPPPTSSELEEEDERVVGAGKGKGKGSEYEYNRKDTKANDAAAAAAATTTTTTTTSTNLTTCTSEASEAAVSAYIQRLVLALAHLGRTGEAVETLLRRLKNEISVIIDRATAHAEDNIVDSAAVRSVPESQRGCHILFHFAAHLYEKIYAVVRRHVVAIREFSRVRTTLRATAAAVSPTLAKVGETTTSAATALATDEGVGGGDGGSSVATSPAAGYTEQAVWGAIQAELRMLLGKYLNVSDGVVGESNEEAEQPLVAAQLFSPSKSKAPPRATQQLFSFANSLNAMMDSAVNIERSLRTEDGGRIKDMRRQLQSDNYTRSLAPEARLLTAKNDLNIFGLYKLTTMLTTQVERFVEVSNENSSRSTGAADTATAAGGGGSGGGDDKALAAAAMVAAAAADEDGLSQFVDAFVRSNVLPILRNEVTAKVMAIANVALGQDSLRALDDGSGAVILESAWAVRCIVARLCTAMYDLPDYCYELTRCLQDLLGQYQLACLERFRHLVRAAQRPPTAIHTGGVVLAAELVQDRKVRAAIEATPAWQRLRPSGAGGATDDATPAYVRQAEAEDRAPEETETELLLAAVGDRLLDRSDVLLDPQTLRAMSHLHESMRWFSRHMHRVSSILFDSPRDLASLWPDVRPVVAEDGAMAADKITKGVPKATFEKLRTTATEFGYLAEDCVMFLRLEIRCHCLYFTVPAIRKANHTCGAAAVETDPLLLSLNKDLSNTEESLGSGVIDFLFEGIPGFLSAILIGNMRHIRKVSTYGVKRMCRNIFALQQNLSNILRSRAADLDAAMQFYELLYLQPEEVLQRIISGGPSFTEEEYKIALRVIAASTVIPDAEGHAAVVQDLGSIFHEYV